MYIDPALVFITISVIIAISIIIVVLASSYAKMLNKYNSSLKHEEHIRNQTYKEEVKILEDARQKAAKILGNANAIDEKDKDQIKKELNNLEINEVKEFKLTTQELAKAYALELDGIKKDTIKITQGIVKTIENDIYGELKDFKEILKKETYDSQKIVEQKIEQDYESARKEVEIYKQEQMKNIDNQIYEILQNVSKIVLGKAIPLETHEQLIIDALNKAKAEKIFR